MKGMDIFCSSPASTAICVSLDQKSMIRNSSRAIDRHTPRIFDGRRASTGSHPSPSRPVSRPKPPNTPKPRKSSSKQSDLNSPLGSSRYLLGDNAFLDVFNDFDPISALVPVSVSVPVPAQSRSSSEAKLSTQYQLTPYKNPPPQLPRLTHDDNQVVVLRVSLHCKGCEGKVRKHISRMEGVRSFNIDFQAKKVTVIGDVTPLGVLASISRVKNAQFWPSPPSSTSSTSSSLSSYSRPRHSTSF